ncbi:hypothetical protein KC354_g5 [Hortaea werneckii]|nr:hypothetical protein KC354_g5 [Hortaea werneckii]
MSEESKSQRPESESAPSSLAIYDLRYKPSFSFSSLCMLRDKVYNLFSEVLCRPLAVCGCFLPCQASVGGKITALKRRILKRAFTPSHPSSWLSRMNKQRSP